MEVRGRPQTTRFLKGRTGQEIAEGYRGNVWDKYGERGGKWRPGVEEERRESTQGKATGKSTIMEKKQKKQKQTFFFWRRQGNTV